jgi:Zn-dependent peptidase ImmA (M78 family)
MPPSRIPLLRALRGTTGVEPWVQGYELGEAARLQLSPKVEPLESVQELLEYAGVHIAFVVLETEAIEAASLYEHGSYPVVLLNWSLERVRYPLPRRAIIAHELCHLLHDGGEQDLTVAISRSTESTPVEQRANAFAPSFLAPKAWVGPLGGDPRRRVVALAEKWGLSFEGAAWHAKNLGLITAAMADKFARLQSRPRVEASGFEREVYRTSPDQFGIEVEVSDLASGLFSERVIAACAEGLISKGRAAELLSIR